MRKETPQALTDRPRVTVVIPCYNYGHFLAECLATVFADSDRVDVDALIVDDCSPDGSADVARELAAADPRVTVIAHETNKRHIATYNEGLAAATGEYVVLLSADDLLAKGSLARSAALLRAHPEVGLVYGFSRRFTGTPPEPRATLRSWSVWDGPEWVAAVTRTATNPIYTPEVMMRATTMKDLVGYDTRLPHAADYHLWLRAGTRGGIGRVNGVDQAFYRVHGANMHTGEYSGDVLDIEQRHLTLRILFDEDGHLLPDPDRLRADAYRALARESLILACRPYERGGDPGDTAALARLAELATEIWPAIRESALWRSWERYSSGRGPLVPAPVTALRDRAVLHLGWRRWRHSGISPAVRSL
ncbi:glycosyltransferase family 2 protein [Actinoplanes sp. G11-F43]|uniref:glycosyltransferase family 2 protein n=1 Tax=Actinoplanes sp. G11-F43 TaxID=3424130 RepID=UPI003D32B0E0